LADLLLRQRRTPLVRAVRLCLQTTGSLGQRIAVGCSGGPDSTALLLSLCALAEPLGLSLCVAAVDHGLRPEGAAEAEAVRRLAASLGLFAEAIAVRVPAGASKMAMARQARYAALADFARRRGASLIAVGHNRDDQAESMLIRFLGGAGLAGLCGMSALAALPVEPGEISQTTADAPPRLLRPLLAVSRADIDAFLTPLRGAMSPLPFFDPSNESPDYLRSRLRGEALPVLRRLAPHLDAHMLALSRQLRADAECLHDLAKEALRNLPIESDAGGVVVAVPALAALPAAVRARVLRLLAEGRLGVSLSQRHVEALLSLCRSQAGTRRLHLASGLLAERRRGRLRLSRPA
jgi:tRNA(Ile)-lysidine synthase